MRTVIIGGGKGCQALMELTRGSFLKELTLDVICVMDPDPNAKGMIYARKHGILTFTQMDEALNLDNLEVVVELTGDDANLEKIHQSIGPRVKVIDHTFAHVFWDLLNAQEEQKQQLNELRVLERRIEKESHLMQSVFDSVPDLLVVLDRNEKVLRTNARFDQVLGMNKDEVLGKPCHEALRSMNLSIDCQVTCPFEEILATGKSNTRILHTPPPNEAYWEVTLGPILNTKGETTAVVETWHRITEKVQLRREIEHAELLFKRFIESARDLISIKDTQGRYQIVNNATAALFNYKAEDFIGKKAEEVLPAEVAAVITHHDQEVLQNKVYRTFEEVLLINGEDRYYNTVRFPLTDYRGETIGICTIARDFTERAILQRQLVQSTKLAAVGKLAAGVAHEINNPLTGILAFAEDMRDETPEGTPFHNDLKVVIRETMRCREIVKNLLDFARQDNPKLETISPNDLVKKAISLVVKLPRLKNIELELKLGENLPLVQADPSQIEQVILNLILNAVDAMQEKGKMVLVTEYDRRHKQCLISVEDSGPGIPENMIDKVFEPFFSSKGTSGLGLAVSWGIVERHQGVIEVDTPESGGAIFRVLLPVSNKQHKRIA